MTKLQIPLTVFAAMLVAGTVQAQTPSVQPAPEVPTTQEPTPPNGVARGVIRPNRPVDSGMVTRPPVQPRHRMPVITPPGTAR
ncbi:MAG: hypothetical protein ACRYF2_07460 [Janthinobacterium lividum]